MTVDRITAIHEAAHGVIGSQFGFDIGRVVLHPPGPLGGVAGHCENRSWRSDINMDPTRALCYMLAGTAAEWKLTGRTSVRDASDRALAADLAATFCERDDQNDPRVKALLASSEALARALVYDATTWRAIERTATALQRTGTVSGRDVQVILREEARR